MSTLSSRRHFLWTSALATLLPATLVRSLKAAAAGALGRIRREIFLASPRPGATVYAYTFYTRPKGLELMSVHEIFTRSDTVDIAHVRRSSDNGRTWIDGEDVVTDEKRPQGTLRRAMRGAVADPITGRFLRFHLEAILGHDDPLEGMWEWVVHYSVSEDGGLTWYLDEEIIQHGAEFNADHPVPGVRRGHNCIMMGDVASAPIFLADGTLLVPVIITPVGKDGKYTNPGGGYTFSDAAVVRGRWAADGRHMEWELSARVQIDPLLSTRGMDEPTLAELPDGRILMVIRGSNDKHRKSGSEAKTPALPGRRWVAYSSDQGRTWTKPAPWTYTSGETFFSPASASRLIKHSSGRLFWLGNILPANPSGNRPRYPFVIAEVDLRSGLLQQASVRIVDDRGPADGPQLMLASPVAREDRETGEILLHLTRAGQYSTAQVYDWTAHAYLFRIPVV